MTSLLVISVLILIYLSYCLCTTSISSATTNDDEWETIHSSNIPFDITTMRKSLSAKEIIAMTSEFAHLSDLSKVLKSSSDGNNRNHFYVYDSIDDHTGWNLSDYNDVSTKAYYNTTSQYKLYNDAHYTTIDTIHVNNIHELSDHHVKLCGIDESHDDHMMLLKLKKSIDTTASTTTRSFLIGSRDGQWHQSKHAQQLFKSRGSSDMNVVRQVTGYMYEESTKCHSIVTENVLPLELFQYMRIESNGNHPFHTEYFLSDEERRSRELLINDDINIAPDPPLVSCSHSGWGSGYAFADTGTYSNAKYNYKLGVYLGCAEFSMKAPGSFNYNYDYTTYKARQSIDLGNGVVCSNCYVFMGAAFMAIIEYTSSYYSGPIGYSKFYIEGKVQGGAGVNVDASITPKSGTFQKPIFPPASNFAYVPVGGGLSLGYKNGGMKSVVTVTSSATGSVSFGAGVTGQASLGIVYTDGSFSMPYSVYTNINPPYINNTLKGSVSVTVELQATQNFKLTYSGYVWADFSAVCSGSETFKLGNLGVASSSVINARRLQSEDSITSGSYVPGDTLRILYEYNSYPKIELITLFLSLVCNDRSSRPIDMFQFNSSSDGSGTVTIEWTVPWDEYYAGLGPNNTYIEIRSSVDMTTVVTTNTFGLTMFTETDGIFLKPRANEIIPLGKEYEVRWNSKLLTYYNTDFIGLALIGSIVQSSRVEFELIGEYLFENGSIKNSTTYRNFTESANTGKAKILFPPSVYGDRFYLNIFDRNYSNVKGWSSGYFGFHDKPLRSLVESKSTSSGHKSVTKRRRKLESCTGSSITTSAAMSGGLTSIGSYVTGNYPTPAPTGSIPLIESSTTCQTESPTTTPSYQPTPSPSLRPTPSPSFRPTASPSFQPTTTPSRQSTTASTDLPPRAPSNQPTYQPTFIPSYQLTSAPYITCSNTGAINCCDLCTSPQCTIVLSSNIVSIDDFSFKECSNLVSVTIPTSITNIGVSAFEGCSSLITLSIPSSVINIGDAVCRGCTSLTSASWSSKVSAISSHAFSGCSSLIGISIPDAVTAISDSALSGCPILCISWNKAITRTIGDNNGVVTEDTAICCANGQFITLGKSFSCSLCPSGTFAIGPVTTCSPCPIGYTSAPGSASCYPCPAGQAATTPGSASCTYWYGLFFHINVYTNFDNIAQQVHSLAWVEHQCVNNVQLVHLVE